MNRETILVLWRNARGERVMEVLALLLDLSCEGVVHHGYECCSLGISTTMNQCGCSWLRECR